MNREEVFQHKARGVEERTNVRSKAAAEGALGK